jgi:hypothetical protein
VFSNWYNAIWQHKQNYKGEIFSSHSLTLRTGFVVIFHHQCVNDIFKLKWPLSLKPLIPGKSLSYSEGGTAQIFSLRIVTYYLRWNLEESSRITCTYIEVEVNLLPTVSRPVCLGVGLPSGAHDQIFVSVWRMRVSWLMVPSLTRGRVCNLLYNCSGPCQSSHSWIKVPQNLRSYLTLSFETPPTWRVRSPYLHPPRTGWLSYTPGHWVPFPSLLTTRRDTVEVFYPASTQGLYLYILFNSI